MLFKFDSISTLLFCFFINFSFVAAVIVIGLNCNWIECECVSVIVMEFTRHNATVNSLKHIKGMHNIHYLCMFAYTMYA